LATALFSIFYYEFRQGGYSRAEAVRQAQVKLRTLSGEALKNEYQEELDLMLKMKKEQINSQRKALKKQLNLVKGTPAYQELENKYKQVQNIQIKLGEMTDTLVCLYQRALPFAHPQYWAAFTCQGMR
jgi:CHAT domain-containing protein